MCSHQDSNQGPPTTLDHQTEHFPQMDGKFSVHKNMNWKINTNRRNILNPSNRREKNVYRPENIIQSIGTKSSANRCEFSSS